jgi:uncharacterized alkaline shock family protein YloU
MSAAQTNPKPDRTVTLDGVTIAPGVVETIVGIAAEEVEGVAGVVFHSSIRRMGSVPAVDVLLVDGKIVCGVHIIADFGFNLPELGAEVQRAVSHALDGQMGIKPALVDVYIDGIAFTD